MPQLEIPLRQVSSMSSRLPGAVAADSNPKAGNLTETAAGSNWLAEALAGSRIFREYQRAFAEATGLPLTLRTLKGWQLAHQDDRNQNGFCALMSKENHSCAACLRMQQQVCDGVNGVPCTLRCQFGLNESAVGVKIGKDIIAYLQTGQVFFKAPKLEQTNRVLDQIKALDINVNRREAVLLYNETPVVQPGVYQATIRLLQFFADQLGALANQILLQQKDVEPAQITRARQYIEANSQEELFLAGVARQVGMSTCHFCKRFRKVTGVNFTRYVSCVRVEKAKNLLLNPNSRVSEIAFEVGFQSLTSFNRIFKVIAGQSPTEYRRHLFTNLDAREWRKCPPTPTSASKRFHPNSNRSTTTHRRENSTVSSAPILERNSRYAF
jgi:AraC-like DNA-binding protein/ligand-binding sensor protein